MSESPDSSCNPPTAATFSFSAPFPALSSSTSPTSTTSSSALKQRRVSLALPSSPRLVQAWNFRDDTGLTSHVAETSAPMPERKGKIRKIADDGDRHETTSSFIIQHKKPRKKWSEEETRMLVEGCNTASSLRHSCLVSLNVNLFLSVGCRQLEGYFERSETKV